MGETESLVSEQFGIGRSLIERSRDHTELPVFGHKVSVNMGSEIHI